MQKNNDLKAMQSYLKHYAEPEVHAIQPFIDSQKPNKTALLSVKSTQGTDEKPSSIPHYPYQHCIVIPAYNEDEQFVTRIAQGGNTPVNMSSPTLLIIVINQPEHDNNTSKNQQLWETITQQGHTLNQSEHHHWLTHQDNHSLDILLIQRFRQKIPRQQGVGLARKIGCDIACQMIQTGHLNSLWIHTTDADTHLPSTYFNTLDAYTSKTNNQRHISAIIYPYQHKGDSHSTLLRATQYYEQALRYYVEGLTHANSPYAYQTLGSCITSNAIHYCQARGFPKKSGGEDFYLLNKLAKLGNIISLKQPILAIDARFSDRAPFGTGPSVQKIVDMAVPDEEYYYYHPHCFIALKQLIKHFDTLFSYKANCQQDLAHYHPWLAVLSPELQRAIKKIKIETLLSHIDKQVHSQEQCLRHCHHWLDAFKTLKLIHHLEEDYPNQPLCQTVNYFS